MAYTRTTSDTLSSPMTATIGTPIQGNLGTTTPKNVADYYRINVANAGTLNINLTNTAVTAGSTGVRYTLYYGTSSGTYLFSNLTSSTTVEISAGTYTLYVGTLNAYTRNTDYQIDLTQTATVVDEAGNTLALANTDTIGSLAYDNPKTIAGKVGGYNLAVGVIDPADYYKIVLAGASNLTLTKTTLPSSLTATILNSSGTALTSLNKLSAGTYYLYINGAGSRASSQENYSVGLTATEYVPPSLTYSGTAFTEASANDGSVTDTITATLANDTFVGSVGASLPITGTGLPNGLSLSAVKASDTTATIKLTGKATSNNAVNSISNFGFAFGNGAFTSGIASDVTNYSKTGLSITFTDNVTASGSLSYSSASISETTANNGALTNISATLTGDTFAGAIDSVIPITVTNLPAGLTASATKLSDTTALIRFAGNATLHQQPNSVSNFTITFGNSAFTGGNASVISNSTKAVPINFTNNTRSLAFDKTSLNEISTNNGAIDGFITVTLTGDTFVGTTNATLPITTANVPTGLTATATKLSDTTAKIAFIGNATNHALANSVTSVKVVFGDSAFSQQSSSLVTNNSTTQNFGLVFKDLTALSYSSTAFNETSTNDGTVTSITATLTSETFAGEVGGALSITATGLPAGFTGITATKVDDTHATIALAGNATLHQAGHSTTSFGFSFGNNAFTGGSATAVANSTKALPITFTNNPRRLVFDKSTLNEVANNDGAIEGSITVNLYEETTAPKGDAFVLDANNKVPVTVTNLPAGLTAVVTRPTYSNQAVITFTGNATNHSASNSISNLKIVFPDSAFKQGYSSLVTNNSTTQNFSLTFKDTPSLAYSTNIFIEADANNGSIGNNVTVTLTGDTFAGTVNGVIPVTTTNVPSNLTVRVIKVDDTHATISLVGNATNHANANDISNLGIAFSDGAFTSTSTASSVTNSTKIFYVDFADEITGADGDNNSFEDSTGITSAGLINSYGKTISSSIGAPATSTNASDKIDYHKFTLAYKGKVYADNTLSSITTYVKDDAGVLQPISSTVGVELSAGEHLFKVATTASTEQSYAIKLRAITSPAGTEIIAPPAGAKNLTSPYTTEGFFGVLDFGSSQNLDAKKWNSAGVASSSPSLANSLTIKAGNYLYSAPAPVSSIIPIEVTEQEGHVRNIITTREELFPVDPTKPTVSKIPMYSDTSGNLILNYSYTLANNVTSTGTNQNTSDAPISLLNTTQKTAVRKAFDEWEKVAKIKFVDVTGTSKDTYDTVNMFIGNVSAGSTAPYAAYIRAWSDSSNQLLKTDFWINIDSSGMTTPAVGNYGYMAYMHEVGHALGLKHPGNYNAGGGGANGPFLTTALDTHQYSIMSYNSSTQLLDIAGSGYTFSGGGTTAPFESAGSTNNSKAITPSLFDIPAVQYLYGSNPTTTSIDNVYSWNANQNAYASISDIGGTDTIDTSNQSQPQTINLKSGKFSGIGAFDLNGLNGVYFTPNNNLSINYLTVIENVTGGSGNDVITGNSVDNILDGKLGNDYLIGGDGNNSFNFTTTPSSANVDTITDFKAGDRINLSLAIFTTLGGSAGNELASSRYSDSTTQTADTRVYADRSVNNQVSLYYDSDGSGSTAGVKFATLTSFTSSLTASNFGIIA